MVSTPKGWHFWNTLYCKASGFGEGKDVISRNASQNQTTWVDLAIYIFGFKQSFRKSFYKASVISLYQAQLHSCLGSSSSSTYAVTYNLLLFVIYSSVLLVNTH